MPKRNLLNPTIYCYKGIFIQKFFKTEEELVNYNNSLDMSKYGKEEEHLRSIYTTYYKITYLGTFQNHPDCFCITPSKYPDQYLITPSSSYICHAYGQENYALYNYSQKKWLSQNGNLQILYYLFSQIGVTFQYNPYPLDIPKTSSENPKKKKITYPNQSKN